MGKGRTSPRQLFEEGLIEFQADLDELRRERAEHSRQEIALTRREADLAAKWQRFTAWCQGFELVPAGGPPEPLTFVPRRDNIVPFPAPLAWEAMR